MKINNFFLLIIFIFVGYLFTNRVQNLVLNQVDAQTAGLCIPIYVAPGEVPPLGATSNKEECESKARECGNSVPNDGTPVCYDARTCVKCINNQTVQVGMDQCEALTLPCGQYKCGDKANMSIWKEEISGQDKCLQCRAGVRTVIDMANCTLPIPTTRPSINPTGWLSPTPSPSPTIQVTLTPSPTPILTNEEKCTAQGGRFEGCYQFMNGYWAESCVINGLYTQIGNKRYSTKYQCEGTDEPIIRRVTSPTPTPTLSAQDIGQYELLCLEKINGAPINSGGLPVFKNGFVCTHNKISRECRNGSFTPIIHSCTSNDECKSSTGRCESITDPCSGNGMYCATDQCNRSGLFSRDIHYSRRDDYCVNTNQGNRCCSPNNIYPSPTITPIIYPTIAPTAVVPTSIPAPNVTTQPISPPIASGYGCNGTRISSNGDIYTNLECKPSTSCGLFSGQTKLNSVFTDHGCPNMNRPILGTTESSCCGTKAGMVAPTPIIQNSSICFENHIETCVYGETNDGYTRTSTACHGQAVSTYFYPNTNFACIWIKI